MVLYQLAVMGAASDVQIAELTLYLSQAIEPFGLRLNHEVELAIRPNSFNPNRNNASAVAFFGGVGVSEDGIKPLLREGIPILPVVSAYIRIHEELPMQIMPINSLAYDADGPERIATALLECAGLLPRQRRVFVSYRRSEAREAALQLFDALSVRLYDVFLDTHGIAPGDDFQAVLWHRLCDSDVLIMLDTPSYFESRWTKAEFGRALAKNISVLRVGWPNVIPSPRIVSKSRVDLSAADVNATTGRLSEDAIHGICIQIEAVRSQSHAVRHLSLFSNLKQGIECIGGSIMGVGLHKAIYLCLPDGNEVVVYPAVGVPTSSTLHEASIYSSDRRVAVVYDHIGLHTHWMEHLAWLGSHIQTVRLVKATEAAWRFADWEM